MALFSSQAVGTVEGQSPLWDILFYTSGRVLAIVNLCPLVDYSPEYATKPYSEQMAKMVHFR